MSVSVTKARKILGKNTRSMSDPEVQDLINQFYGLAEIIAEMVTSGSNMSTMGIEANRRKEENGIK